MSPDDVAGELRSGMTIGIGGWGSRRKPMALVRAIVRSGLTDLTIVSYGGPDVGLLMAAGRVRRVVCGFVTLDTIPLEPHVRAARQAGSVEAMELDEGMLQWGLRAAAMRHGIASLEELNDLAAAWEEWGADPAAFFAFPWCRVLAWP